MINMGKSFDIHDYIEILLRRKWYIVVPLIIVFSAAIIYAFNTPKKYRASTLILVTPQKVPVDFVKPTVTSRIEDRLQSIGQEIMSRTRLEQIISEFKLYREETKSLTIEEIVELMRKDVQVQIKGREGYFTISYIGIDPRTVTTVTNKLASLFIEENLKLREQQAQGTTEFLSQELTAKREKLEEMEGMLTQFKKQHMYELPSQQSTNLSVLTRLQQQLQTTGDALKSAQERKLVIHKQLNEMKLMAASLKSPERSVEEDPDQSTPLVPISQVVSPKPNPSPVPRQQVTAPPKPRAKSPFEGQLEILRNQLLELEARYTERHPDMQATKKKIADLEEKARMFEERRKQEEERARLEQTSAKNEEKTEEKAEEKVEKAGTLPAPIAASGLKSDKRQKQDEKGAPETDPFYKEMEGQLAVTDIEIQRLKEEESKIKAKIADYQLRVENTPIRELAMATIARDHENLRGAYESLLKKSQEAQQAENLERRQKGEQFKVIDPARLPEKPFKPDIPKVLLFGLLMGIGSGFGMAFFREQLDKSFRDAGDLEATLGLRVIANIPKFKYNNLSQSA